MLDIVITGIGLSTALGKTRDSCWQNLIAGHSGIKPSLPFFREPGEELPLATIDKQPAELKSLTQLVVASALEDAGLVPPLPDCAVVIGSSRNQQASWEFMAREMYREDPPQPRGEMMGGWLDFLPHMNAIATARQIGSTGIVLAPMAACATGIWAIAQGVQLIQSGQSQRVIAGASEAAITPLTITGFHQMGALAKTGAYPFDVNREGLVLGEGAAVFVLEPAELARIRGAKIYGKILGFGLTTDAYHPNAPDPQGKSAIAAIKQCLQRSNLNPTDIDYIHAHGTGTILNDRVESLVIQRIFSHRVPVSSTKGATGHTLGASGALGVAFSALALKQQILPPCVGLRESEFDLNLVRTAYRSEIKCVLSLSFGFGGQNAVIALRQ